jgi:hypothetical protein
MMLSSPPARPVSSINPDQYNSDWDQFFQLLVRFSCREHHCNVPVQHLEFGKNLWVWLMVQKLHGKKGTLDSFRKRLLEYLGVDWNLQVSLWDLNFLLLLQYRDREGHMRIPRRHSEDGQQLGAWICKQRVRQNKAGTLFDLEKERRLNEIGFIWKGHEEKWEIMFMALAQYKRREGHLRVPTRHVEDGQKLGDWITLHRAKKKAGTLAFERERRLSEIGFIWEGHHRKWDTMFRALMQFQQREGHMKVPRRHIEHIDHHCNTDQHEYQFGAVKDQLGAWLINQRLFHARGTLDAKRRERLESVGVKWVVSK